MYRLVQKSHFVGVTLIVRIGEFGLTVVYFDGVRRGRMCPITRKGSRMAALSVTKKK